MKKFKKINKNIFVFAFVALFVIFGLASKANIVSFASNVISFVKLQSSFEQFEGDVQKTLDDGIRYHNKMIDLNSIVLRLTGKDYVVKDDAIVAKIDNSYLMGSHEYIEDETIDEYSDNIKKLYDCSVDNNAKFLYVMCPEKGYSNQYPAGINDYSKTNCDRFVSAIENKNIPILNLQHSMEEENKTPEDIFFITDHHWKPTSGFWASTKICESLNQKYQFEYNKEYANLDNYNIKTYNDWFLGSQGKKVGQYFTELGVDDFDLITPKFDTKMIESQPIKNETRKGAFENSVLFTDYVKTKDYYSLIPYSAYCGGDFRIQEFTNELNKDGKTFVIVKDSYANVVVPFLTFQANKIYSLDIRDYEYYIGERVNLSEFIEEINPDYVLVIYNGISGEDEAHDRYNFN